VVDRQEVVEALLSKGDQSVSSNHRRNDTGKDDHETTDQE